MSGSDGASLLLADSDLSSYGSITYDGPDNDITIDRDLNLQAGLDVTGDIVVSGTVVGLEEAIEVCIDGGGAVIAANEYIDYVIKTDMTITGWTLLHSAASTTTIGVWVDSYANYPPVIADVLVTPGTTATITGQATSLDLDITKGEIIRFNVNANDVSTKTTIALTGVRR